VRGSGSKQASKHARDPKVKVKEMNKLLLRSLATLRVVVASATRVEKPQEKIRSKCQLRFKKRKAR
jgi:hypothetical protein